MGKARNVLIPVATKGSRWGIHRAQTTSGNQAAHHPHIRVETRHSGQGEYLVEANVSSIS
eukprot:2843980-Heterocapsa_arctica.AAC.1